MRIEHTLTVVQHDHDFDGTIIIRALQTLERALDALPTDLTVTVQTGFLPAEDG